MTKTHLAGQFLVVTHSDYSDYGYHGIYRVLLAYSPARVEEDFKAAVECGITDQQKRFVAWMVAEGYWEQIETEEFWLGHRPKLAIE